MSYLNNINAGDFVRIRTSKEVLEGIVIESHETGIILLKLKSGYNIGIKKEDVLDIQKTKLKRKLKEGEEKGKLRLKKKLGLPDIDMIMTGGTISSRLDPLTGGVKWLTSPEELFKFYPEMFEIVNIKNLHVPFMLASENMSSKEWIKIAEITASSLNDRNNNGVIITHGTDFLHYTSAALSFFLRNLNKPVVLTYAQRSSDRASSDATLNLQCSARIAISDINEVMLVGHANLEDNFCYALRGCNVRKMHSSRRDTFRPINDIPIAKAWPDRLEKMQNYQLADKKGKNKKTKLDAVFNNKTGLIKFYPGQDPEIIDYYSQRYEGIVVETSGLGHLPTSECKHNWLPRIKKAIDNGLVICAAPQTIYGRLDPYVYSPGRELMKAGVIFLNEMLAETAFVKLGWVLAHREWKDKIREIMLKDFAGEIGKRLTPEMFLY